MVQAKLITIVRMGNLRFGFELQMLSQRFETSPEVVRQSVTLMSCVTGPSPAISPSRQNGAATAPQATGAGTGTNPKNAAGENRPPKRLLKFFHMPLPKSAREWGLPG